jgi:glucosamine-6-phosphate deaminase
MRIIVCENYEELSSRAADIFVEQLRNKPKSVLGLATGGTQLGIYQELSNRYNAGLVDFSKAISFNLDEYCEIERDHPQSYYTYMKDNFFDKVKFKEFHLPKGDADNLNAEAAEYEKAIMAAGGIDLQLLGVGVNGHIGFNEPSNTYLLESNHTDLAESTIEANSRYFSENEKQPTSALTMGIGTIFRAKSLVMLVSGKSKAQVAKKLFDDKIYTDIPATLLKLHNDFTVLIDKDAAEG